MNEIFSESIKYFFSEYAYTAVGSAIAILVFGLWYCFARAGTANFIRNRVWAFYAGNHDVKNKAIAECLDEINGVENIRFKTGFKFSSVEKFESFTLWLKRSKIPPYEAAKFSKHFDVNNHVFLIKNFSKTAIVFLCAACLSMAAIVCANYFYVKIQNTAYLIIKKTEFSFSYNGVYAMAYDMVLDAETCGKTDKNVFDEFKEHNISTICNLVLSEDKEIYNSTLSSQRNLYIALIVIMATMSLSFLYKSYYFGELNAFYFKYIK